MKTSEIKGMIRKYNISPREDGNLNIRVKGNLTTEEITAIKNCKSEIISYFEEEKAEEAAKEMATIRFMVIGWESHEVSVDTRYDIDKQLKKIADYYSNDMTFESAKEAYEKAIKVNEEKEIKKVAAEAEIEAVYAEAKATGEKQVLRKYMDECDGTACECSYDAVTVYAMPDGSTSQVRIHTH